MAPYEVRCHSCNVSFPPGTKRCLHCGGKIRGPGPSPDALATPFSLESLEPAEPGQAGPALPTEEPEADEVPRRGGLRMGRMLAWILLALAVTLQRICTGGE